MNGSHCITLRATGRRVPVGAYVTGVRLAIAQPDSTFRHGLETWWPVTGAEIRSDFRRNVSLRMAAALPWYGRGRKWGDDWQRRARIVADRLRARAVTYERDCPAELRLRLAARLYREGEI